MAVRRDLKCFFCKNLLPYSVSMFFLAHCCVSNNAVWHPWHSIIYPPRLGRTEDFFLNVVCTTEKNNHQKILAKYNIVCIKSTNKQKCGIAPPCLSYCIANNQTRNVFKKTALRRNSFDPWSFRFICKLGMACRFEHAL